MGKKGLGLTAGYGISLVGGVLSLTIYARMLGPQTYGQLAVFLALVEAFQGIFFQWHRLALVRYWNSGEEEAASAYLATSHFAWMFIAAAGAFVVLIALCFTNGSRSEWLAVCILALSKSAALYTQEIARASGAVVRYAVASLLLTIGATAGGIVAWSMTHSMACTLYATAAIFLIQTIVCGYEHAGVAWRARFDAGHLRTMLLYGLPLIPVFLATTALTRLDRPILAEFAPAAVVGVYAATSGMISNAISAACLLVVTPSYPWLLREKKLRSKADHQILHARIGLIILAGMLAICIVILLARDVVLPLLLGNTIGEQSQPLVPLLLSVAVIGAFRTHFFDQTYHLHARTRTLMLISLSTLVFSIGGIYFGASNGGVQGLLIGLLFVNVLALCVSAIFVRSLVNTRSILLGVSALLASAGLSIAGGHFVGELISAFSVSKIAVASLSATSGLLVYFGICIAGDIGSVRSLLLRRI